MKPNPYFAAAAQRRTSRVELWPRQVAFADGMMYPEYEGRATYVCAVTPEGMAALDNDPGKFIANLRQMPAVNTDAIDRFVKLGPEYKVTSDPRTATSGKPIQHGIGFRLCVPYRSPEPLDVAVNGHSLKQSETDGYQAWYADGYTQVQINIPPEKSRTADLFVVTCAYQSNAQRNYGWKPPTAVLQKLRGK